MITALGRPIGVWFASVGYVLLSLPAMWMVARFYLERPPLSPAQQAYFDGLGVVDYALEIGLGLMTLVGLALLFFLRQRAVTVLGFAFAANALVSLIHILKTNWLVVDGSIGILIGPLIQLAIYRYAWRLRQRGVLLR